MSMSVDIPSDLQPAIEAALARGGYADEQELVSKILWAAVPALEQYQKLREDVQASPTKSSRVRSARPTSVRCANNFAVTTTNLKRERA